MSLIKQNVSKHVMMFWLLENLINYKIIKSFWYIKYHCLLKHFWSVVHGVFVCGGAETESQTVL